MSAIAMDPMVAEKKWVAYQDDHYKVVEYSGEIQGVVVALFDSWKQEPTLEGDTFGEAFLQKVGISYICIKTALNDWYQGETALKAVAVAAHLVAGRKAVGYGSSMGAYAALNFAEKIGLSRCICFAPQFSIDPRKVPFEKRWASEAANLTFRNDMIAANGVMCDIIFDPLSDDKKHVVLITQSCKVREIRLPFSGHDPGEYLRKTGFLSEIILSLLLPDLFSPINVRSVIRNNRRQNETYWRNLSMVFFRRKNRLAAIHAATISTQCVGGNGYASQSHLANMLHQDGRHLEAISIFQKFLSDLRYRKNAKMWLSRCFRAMGWEQLSIDFGE